MTYPQNPKTKKIIIMARDKRQRDASVWANNLRLLQNKIYLSNIYQSKHWLSILALQSDQKAPPPTPPQKKKKNMLPDIRVDNLHSHSFTKKKSVDILLDRKTPDT